MLGRWYSMGKDLAFYLFILSPILLQLLAVLLVDSLGHLKKKKQSLKLSENHAHVWIFDPPHIFFLLY